MDDKSDNDGFQLDNVFDAASAVHRATEWWANRSPRESSAPIPVVEPPRPERQFYERKPSRLLWLARALVTRLVLPRPFWSAGVAFSLIVGVSIAYSKLVGFLTLQALILLGVGLFDDDPIDYRGLRGATVQLLFWLLLSMAIVVPLWVPIDLTLLTLEWLHGWMTS